MSTTRTEEKEQVRCRLKALEQALTLEQRTESDTLLFRRFLSLPSVRQCSTLLLFYGMGAEPDTRQLFPALLETGKQLLLPRCLPGHQMELRLYRGKSHLIRHRYGMLEPDDSCPMLSPQAVELALVPALCYDETGMRLGRGGGYYDRFLPTFPGKTIGLCRDRFLQTKLPALPHDVGVELVLTETRLIPGQHNTQ